MLLASFQVYYDWNTSTSKYEPYAIAPKIPFTTLQIASDLVLGDSGILHFGDAELGYDATNNAVYLRSKDGNPINFYTTGGISMYGLGNTSVTTIMDAILYDNTTLGINAQGQLYVKGSVGGATTLGSLSNVGTWADSVADVDRIMYQAAGSSNWVAKSLSSIGGGGGVSGDYLPLSGGTLANTGHVLIINRLDDSTPWVTFQKQGTELGRFGIDANNPLWYNTLNNTAYSLLHSGNYSSYALPLDGSTSMKGSINWGEKVFISGLSHAALRIDTPSGYIQLGPQNTSHCHIYTNRDSFYFNKSLLYANGHTILHANNYSSYALPLTGGTVEGAVTIKTDGYALYWGDRTQYRLGSNGYADFYIFDDNPYSPSRFRIGTGGAERMTILANGNVGVGTTSPAYKLDVNGGIRANGYFSMGNYIKLHSNEWTDLWVNWGGAEAGGNLMLCGKNIVFHCGNVAAYQVGMTLDASSNLLVYGGITMYSDQRKKTILNHVELSLKQIADAPLIEHFYNSDDKKTTHVGSIAQYWANMNDWFCKLDSEGYYTMEIQNCALASAISIARELDRYESKTDKTINKLKKKIALLEEEVEQLRSRL